MLTRLAILFALISVAGCSSAPPGSIRIDGNYRIESLIVASPYRGGWCYTRYEQGLPYDEICESGDRLLYTTNLERSRTKKPDEIPEYIFGLFDYMSAERAVSQRLPEIH